MVQNEHARSHRGWLRIAVLAAVVVGLAVAAKFLPLKDYAERLLEWVDGLGVWGPVTVIVIYVAACVFMLPGSILTLGAGFLFGPWWGTVTVSIASTLGASAAFWVGRTVARDWIGGKVAGNRKFAAVDEAVGKQGFKMVLLTRLSPVFPFNLLNYAFGLTKVRFRDYVLASWIGMLPGTIMYVYIGSAFKSLAEVAGEREKSALEHVFFWGGLVVAIVVAVFVTRVARRALKEAAPEIEAADGPPASQAGAGTEASHE